MGFSQDHCAASPAWGRIRDPPQQAQAKKEKKRKREFCIINPKFVPKTV